jgi:hypothetical protein
MDKAFRVYIGGESAWQSGLHAKARSRWKRKQATVLAPHHVWR